MKFLVLWTKSVVELCNWRRLMKLAMVLLLMIVAVYADKYDNYMAKERYKKALTYIEKKKKPQERTPEIWYKIGYASEMLTMYEKALSCYLSANKMSNDKYYESVLGATKMYNQLGQWTSAYLMGTKALELKKDNDSYREMGIACYKLERYSEAKTLLVKVSSSVTAAKMLAKIYLQDGEVDKSMKLYNDVFVTKPSVEVARILAKHFLAVEKTSDAIFYLEYVLDNDKSKNEKEKLDLARCYFKTNEYLDGLKMYKNIDEGILNVIDFYNMGIANESLEKIDEAEKFFYVVVDKGKEGDSVVTQSRQKLAVILIDRKEFKNAENQLKKLDREDMFIQYLSAQCYDGLQDYKLSTYFSKEYLKKDSSNVAVKLILANAYEHTNYKTLAENLRKSIIDSDPNNASNQLIMGKYYYNCGRYTQAIKFFDKSYLLEQDPVAAEMLAVCAYRIKQYPKAKDAAESAVLKNESSVPAREVLYKIFMNDKKYSNAAEHLEKLASSSEKMTYLNALVTCYSVLQQKDKLLIVDERIIRLDLSNETSRRRLAIDRFDNKKYKESYELYLQLSAINKMKEIDYPNTINCALQLNRKTEAITLLKIYSSIRPRDASVYKWLADVCYDEKKYDESLQNYKTALRYDSEIKGVHGNLTMILIYQNSPAKVIISSAMNAINRNETSDDMYMGLGNAYVSINDFSNALISYQTVHKNRPKDLDLLRKVAECQVKVDKISDAIISYEQLAMMDSSKVFYKVLGELYDGQSKEVMAIDCYKKYSTRYADDKIVTRIAMYEYTKGQFETAVKYFDMMTSYSRITMYAHGRSAFMIKDYKAVIKIFSLFIVKYVDHKDVIDAYRFLAIAYDRSGDFKSSIAYYLKYVSAVHDSDADYRLAVLQEKNVNEDEAVKTFTKNIGLYPKDYRNFYKLGILELKDMQKSKSMLEAAVLLNDTLFDAWLRLGQIYHKLSDEDNKIRAYKKVISLQPHNFEANKYLGIALYKKAKLKDAILYLEFARNQIFNDPDVLFTLALCYISDNQPSEVLLLLETAKKLKPNDPDIRYTLALRLAIDNRLEDAMKEMKSLLLMSETDQYFKSYIGMLFKAQKYSKIEAIIKEKRRKDPENVDLLMAMAKAQVYNNQTIDAIETYKMVLIINPNKVDALYERAKLHLLRSEYEQAETFFKRVLIEDQKNALAELGLAKVYKALKNQDEYSKHLKRAFKFAPENKEVLKEMNPQQ